jgi:glycosyltransferase involved in cell wall biosynthesis
MLCHFNVFGETAVQCEQCGRVIENKTPEIPIYSACRFPANHERQAQSHAPAITVVMPVWNGEKYLHQAIDSILNQTQKDFELIIVNDGSTDSTPDIINHIARQSDNVFVIHQPNKGTGAALNTGFAIARGKYQTWWSADSWVEPNWLSELQQALDNNPDFGFVYSDWKRLHQESGHERTILVPDFDRTRLQKECYIGPSWMWRKEIKDQVGEFSVDLCEDYDMHLRMAGATPFLHLPEVLVHWHDHQDNVTNRICRPQHFAPGLRVRARHKWKHSQMRVAWIGPYVDAASVGWFLANGLNEVGGDQIAVRHILGKHRHMNQIEDLLINRDDDEIRHVLDPGRLRDDG